MKCRLIGIGLRGPGCSSGDGLWEILGQAASAISDYPDRRSTAGRWASMPSIARGGFINDLERFDYSFFGLTRAEAEQMDPGARQLLEVSWECIEDAGVTRARLSNARVGTYVGAMASDFEHAAVTNGDLSALVGRSRSAIASRLSFLLGLRGPSLVIDTDRSSSLVALDAAYRDLALGRIDAALVCAVNLILDPEVSLAFSRAGLLAADARCKFGDSGADGFVRSEAACCVLLASETFAPPAPTYARLVGSAVNHDGGRSGDFVSPSVDAQCELIGAALKDAGLSPRDIGYLEAHGTGTALGDKVELGAIARVFARAPDASSTDRLLVGSLKSNLGHTEAAAGLMGVCKVALSLAHGVLPATLHVSTPNPAIDWASAPMRLCTERLSWPSGSPRRAGVSAFGLTGTNAHCILEAAGLEQRSDSRNMQPESEAERFILSAPSEEGLRRLAGVFASDATEYSAAVLAGALRLQRDRHKFAVVGEAASVAEIRQEWRKFAVGDPASGLALGELCPKPRVVFVCPGQGAQWPGMGDLLYERSAPFRDEVDRIDAEIQRQCGWSVRQVWNDPDQLEDIAIVQPLLFTMSAALAALWRAQGLVADVVIGTSMGEVAASYISSSMSLEQAVRVITFRSQLMRQLAGRGAMAAVLGPQASVVAAVSNLSRLSIAVYNSPMSTVVAGDSDQIEILKRQLEPQGLETKILHVTVASHSPEVDSILDTLEAGLSAIGTPQAARLFFSTLENRRGVDIGADYWRRNLREPVRFAQAVDALFGEGANVFVELSPHAILLPSIAECAEVAKDKPTLVASMQRGEDPLRILAAAENMLVCVGALATPLKEDLDGLRLPHYPWAKSQLSLLGDVRHVPSIVPSPTLGSAPIVDLHGPETLRTRLAAASANDHSQLVRDFIAEAMRDVLRLPKQAPIAHNTGFRQLGLTSLMMVTLRNRLSSELSRSLPATFFFDHPTIERAAEAILSQQDSTAVNGSLVGEILLQCGAVTPKQLERALTEQAKSPLGTRLGDVLIRLGFIEPGQLQRALVAQLQEPIAIVGIAVRFPGHVGSLEEYWQLLSDGRDAITAVDDRRWPVSEATNGVPRFGGFIDDVSLFDAEFFGLSSGEAQRVDPQQRLLLELSVEALEHAGAVSDALSGTRTGVFIGVSNYNEYERLKGDQDATAFDGVGDATSILAGRIAYHFGFQGPAVATDTACSSSLVALHLAAQSLRSRECAVALVGAANLILTPHVSRNFARAGMLAPNGRCKTFDASADGYVRSEGCAVLVLKRLSDAQRDGDDIHAVVLSTATNQDGRSAGLTAPNGQAQEDLMRRALTQASIAGEEVSYVEAHGTGTKLGDPIELGALARVYSSDRPASRPLLVGSVKSNIGHLEAAAGLAGLIKVVLALKHRRIPASLHVEHVNPSFDWGAHALSVVTKQTQWLSAGTRVAAVSAFGFSGTNAHVIVQEPPQRAKRTDRRSRLFPLVLSAKSEDALKLNVEKWASYLEETSEHLTDVAYTALHHRALFETRLVLEAKDTKDAAQKLRGYLKGETVEGLRTAIETKALEALKAEAKAAGGERVDIPTYAFLRKRYWVEQTQAPKLAGESTGYELLGSEMEQADGSTRRIFTSELSPSWPSWLKDHVVQGEVVLPGAAQVELLAEAAKTVLGHERVTLKDVAIERAFIVKEPMRIQTVVETDGSVVVYGRQAKAKGSWQVYARGQIATCEETKPKAKALPELAPVDEAKLYGSFEARGLRYGECFRTLVATGAESAGTIACQVESKPGSGRFVLSPMLLDGCLQSIAGAMGKEGSDDAYLPFGFSRIHVFTDAAPNTLSGRVELVSGQAGLDEIVRANITLTQKDGEVVCVIEDASFKRARQGAIAEQATRTDAQRWLYETVWQKVDRANEARAEVSRAWLVVSEKSEGEVAKRYAEALQRRGVSAKAVDVSALQAEEESKRDREEERGIVWIVARADEVGASTAATVRTRTERSLKALLQETQRLIGAGVVKTHLTVVTEGGTSAGGPVKRPWHASVWGFTRVLATEHPEVSPALIDVGSYEQSAEAVGDELLGGDREEEVALYAERLVARVARVPELLQRPMGAESFTLQTNKRGQLDGLRLERAQRKIELAGNEVEIEVDSVGLNFRDVLNALGMYPGDAGELGGDLGGVVTRVSSSVKELSPGDRVYGMAGGAFSRYVVTDARLVSKTPQNVSNEAASTLVSTFLTVLMAFEDKARLVRGERVLIHSAAGGVGLAAVQVAKAIGAEIYATASRSKHAYLRALGIEHVYDSRSTAFYEEILRDTNGVGVDVVLNALTGDKLSKSLQLVRENGRFVEIGKTELLSQDQVHAINPRAQYVAVALDAESVANPEWFVGAYARLNRGLATGLYAPLPYETSDIERVRTTFREMAQGSHVGKRVVRLKEHAIVEQGGTYIVTGGLGALGRLTAEWLSKQGAKQIVLVGRSEPSEEAKASIERMRQAGATVVVEAADITDGKQLEVVVTRARQASKTKRISGVMHAAGVLEDATIKEQSWEKFEQVLGPKAVGAQLLLELIPEATTFELFGSISSAIGNGGQANYAAANAYLTGLSLTEDKRCIQTTDWWAWAQAGMAQKTVKRGAASFFEEGLSDEAGLAALGEVMRRKQRSAIVVNVELSKLVDRITAFGKRRFSLVVQRKARTQSTDFLRELNALPEQQRQGYVQGRLIELVQAVLGTSAPIGVDVGFMDIGVDSLMAVEVRNRLNWLIAKTAPTTVVFDYPNVGLLAGFVLRAIGMGTTPQDEQMVVQKKAAAREETGALADAQGTRERIQAAIRQRRTKT